MTFTKIPDAIDRDRRHFLGTAVASLAFAGVAINGSVDAQSGTTQQKGAPIKPGTNTSFASIKQIDAGLLHVGYAEAGPADGPAVILLHGWPYDIYSFVDVTPLLAAEGYHVIVPYLRGYGSTRFLSDATFRNGQPAAIATDMVDFVLPVRQLAERLGELIGSKGHAAAALPKRGCCI